ncbi:MAG: ATP-binding protein [Burkholderiaceae bacterium]
MSRSLQLRLSLWIAAFIAMAGLVGGAISFVLAYDDAHEMQDDQLQQIAELLVATRAWPERSRLPKIKGIDSDQRVVVERLPADPAARKGLRTLDLDDHTWRAYERELPGGDRLRVRQRTELRDEIALAAGERTLAPLLAMIPLLILVVMLVVRNTFKPVVALARQLDRASASHPEPLPQTDVPREIAPFVASINGLLLRVSDTMERQRRFVADAAHELRSPVTALSLQAENLEQAEMSAAARERFLPLKQGLARTRALLEQLLTMARAQAESGAVAQVTELDRVVREVVRDLYPQAEAKGIDLGVERIEPVRVRGGAFELATLMRNAIDNAIRYSPAGARVDVSVYAAAAQAVFQVVDGGPGIDPGERTRVFDPFYRIAGSGEQGSGLGLSIVRGLADRLGGQVSLSDVTAPGTTGLVFTYRQPLAPSS